VGFTKFGRQLMDSRLFEPCAWTQHRKIFNDDIEGGVRQVDLSQQYGYSKQSVHNITLIYPALKSAGHCCVEYDSGDVSQIVVRQPI